MKRLSLSLVAAAAGLLIAPNLASARPAVTTDATSLRAGPAFDFPVVDSIPGDVTVNVHGCVRGYRWCDVSWRDARGWVPGNELAYLHEGRRVTVVEYGPRIGLPVVAFAFDTYWDRYYRGRSWYGERARWRTVWRDRDDGDRRRSDRDRREGKIEDRTDRREGKSERRAYRSEVDRTDRDVRRQADRDRRTDRDDSPKARTGRSELRQGESRGFAPQTDRGARQGMDRGDAGRGRAEPSMRERGGGPAGFGGGGRDGGGRDGGKRGEGRPN